MNINGGTGLFKEDDHIVGIIIIELAYQL